MVESRRKELSKQTESNSSKYWRTPAKILKEVIQQDKFETIGGNLQLAMVNILKFDIYSVAEPFNPNMTLKFINFDVFNDISNPVDKCLVSINGMFLEP